MAASMIKRVMQSFPIFRSKVPVYTAHCHILQSVKPQTAICRTITQEQMEKNKRVFQKKMFQYIAAIVILVAISPYVRKIDFANLEPRRDKKRRKLQALKEAEERQNLGENLQQFGSDHNVSLSNESLRPVTEEERKSVFPIVKAAKVFDEGDGYVPPRSHRFNFIADAVDRAAPSVVYIEIQGRHPMMGRQQIPISNGSGFIVSPDGLVLTNAHVVANKIRGQQSVKVKLPDGRMVDGHVVAVDSVSDLAAVKIDDGNNLPVMKLGKSSRLRPGEWVIAMGSPLTLSNTITAGIVSTVSRTSKELGLRKDIDYIQTDAAINFGNSGGPLVNLDGEAIGINTMKVTSGISFAIPIDNAREFLEEVQKRMKSEDAGKGWTGWFSGGKKSPGVEGEKRGYIGITMLSLNPGMLNDLKSRMADFPDVTHGVLVYRIIVGSPAQVAGMKAGDIITHIDGKAVKSATAVYNAVHTLKKMEVSVVRGPSSQKLTLTIVPEEAQ
ncbi:serine protease HTRA2, mitochondrial-like [Acanthaster planci]|uniref:Serine protease HTRA2, mitochondrial n=1 Tax=Acanthaster planci TaxID=133434 RepID=A0A8B7XJC3_ACAPL|nr:serine protease HTRA2, mitochondrial-like [Acanthaster planci]